MPQSGPGRAGYHAKADVRPAVRVREREHVLRDLRRGVDGAPARGGDREGQEAGRPRLRADGRPQDGRLRGRAGGLARHAADRADQTCPGRDAQDAGQKAEEITGPPHKWGGVGAADGGASGACLSAGSTSGSAFGSAWTAARAQPSSRQRAEALASARVRESPPEWAPGRTPYAPPPASGPRTALVAPPG